MKNLYDVLQVSETASDEVIEKAYKTLVKKYHPDLQPPEKKASAEAMMKSLNEAYETLSDPAKKKKYDEERQEEKRRQEAERQAWQREYQPQEPPRQDYQEQREETPHIRYTRVVPNQEMRQEEVQPQEPQNLPEYFSQMMRNSLSKSKRKREQRRVQNAYREGYQEAYAQYFRSLGYKVKQPWTWRRVKELLKSILIFSAVVLVFWLFPPTHKLIVSIYTENPILKKIVDMTINFFVKFFQSFFGALFGK